jgi:hypothetical protein
VDETSDPPVVGVRRAPLPGGGCVRVRPVEPGDVDGLVALYDTLSDEDRHRRFFSAFVPDRPFFEHMASVVSRGGFGVVAVDAEDRIVGEANYEPLPDGDGELGMLVAEGWRGWLGAHLFDTLAEAASLRGVPNIEAEVLVVNGRMLSLLRHRGYATLTSDDWTSVRLMVGTAGTTPVWPPAGPGGPDADRPRVLVEAGGGRSSVGAEAEARGLAVITCSGPHKARHGCPVLAGRPCPLAAEADAIVVANPDDALWQAVIAGHRAQHPGVPVYIDPRDGPRLDAAMVERAAQDHRRGARWESEQQGGAPCTP